VGLQVLLGPKDAQPPAHVPPIPPNLGKK